MPRPAERIRNRRRSRHEADKGSRTKSLPTVDLTVGDVEARAKELVASMPAVDLTVDDVGGDVNSSVESLPTVDLTVDDVEARAKELVASMPAVDLTVDDVGGDVNSSVESLPTVDLTVGDVEARAKELVASMPAVDLTVDDVGGDVNSSVESLPTVDLTVDDVEARAKELVASVPAVDLTVDDVGGDVNSSVESEGQKMNLSENNEKTNGGHQTTDQENVLNPAKVSSSDDVIQEGESSSSDSVSEDSSDSDIQLVEVVHRASNLSERQHPANSFHSDDVFGYLSPIEDLDITVPEEECLQIGHIQSITGNIVVIRACTRRPVLDNGTILFVEHGRRAIGEICDVFGQVKEPYYAIRVNSEEHAYRLGLNTGVEVQCVPKTEYTNFTFANQLRNFRGSDASVENNEEPSQSNIDYSDDEEEREAARIRRRNRRLEGASSNLTQNIDDDEDIHVVFNRREVEAARDGAKGPHRRWRTFRGKVQFHPDWRRGMHLSLAASRRIGDGSYGPATASAMHPPGHPPIRRSGAGYIMSQRALRAARSVNAHPNAGQSNVVGGHMPPPSSSQGLRVPLLPTPETPPQGNVHPAPGSRVQHPYALLPTPSTRPCRTSTETGPSFSSPENTSRNGVNPYRLPIVEANQIVSLPRQELAASSLRSYGPLHNHPSERPVTPLVTTAPSLVQVADPLPGNGYLNVPPICPPTPMASEGRDLVPPLCSQDPFQPERARSYVVMNRPPNAESPGLGGPPL
ncbi:H/ACA ribonucleoprotein complex non-core subunit NAF1 isoform X2 [Hetaerina americana]|uniref:H/ACA ribonucleoprotein complex non-core subunit NAF1 isoform X2 n=1 Tax=Hetaerina americana TaxID=62018 RepID=UPI003A7F36FC